MRHRYLLPAAVLVAASATPAFAVDPADLRPGLVAEYSGSAGGKVTRLEPTAALTLNAGETPHPQLPGLARATWTGYVNVTRPGKHTFAATTAGGQLVVEVGGKRVLTVADPKAGTAAGEPVQLDGGVLPIRVDFLPVDAAHRLELLWEGPGFVREPLNNRFLGHLPKERPAAFATDVALEHGRFKFEELACVKCHKPAATDAMAKTLADRVGPNLTEIAKRAYPGWIDAWLADPAKHRPHTTMPKMFTADDHGAAERFAVTRYLASLAAGPTLDQTKQPTISPGDLKQSLERGRVLYHVTGCAACHQEAKPVAKNEEDDREPLRPEEYIHGHGTLSGPTGKYPLGAVGSKTRPEQLAAFLLDPLKTHPSGRMPRMNLNQQEATDLARYLCRTVDGTTSPEMPAAPKTTPAELGKQLAPPIDLAALAKLPADKQWAELGRVLTVTKGCVNCHTVEANGKAVPPATAFPSLDAVKAAGAKGCIGPKPDPAKVPVYKLELQEAAALAAFTRTGLTGAGSPAPTYNARVALRRFNCLNCHTRDGEGGIPNDLADQMRLLEKAENADDVRPPLLTGVGHKTRTAWLKSVLTAGGRARPWMQLRMPQYGEAHVGFLPEALARLEGTVPDDTIRKIPAAPQQIGLGRQIVGKGGLGCISCHDIGGVANTGTRGPDLATINQRVRYEWYDRWMHQPLRMAPGTRMPQAFVDGKSTLSTVLKGDPKGQAEAMWAYLSLGPGLPLPDGLEPPKGLVVAVRDRPEVLRTFMPDAGAKAIAVGYPGGVNLAFSADECRLAYAWAGNFIDASPVWANRGGAPAKLLGPRFWTAVAGHPWGLTADAKTPPDFVTRAKDPAFGLPLPLEPARIYTGPTAVKFDGYGLDADGRPAFRYSLDEGKGGVLKVAEMPVPIKTAIATGFMRTFALEVPGGRRAWLLGGQTAKAPRVLGVGAAKTPALDLKVAEPLVSANGTRIVLPQDADRVVVLEAIDAPAGTDWRFVPKPGGGWLAVLRLPEAKGPWKGTFTLALWALPKDDEALLKGLATK